MTIVDRSRPDRPEGQLRAVLTAVGAVVLVAAAVSAVGLVLAVALAVLVR